LFGVISCARGREICEGSEGVVEHSEEAEWMEHGYRKDEEKK